MTVVHRDVRAAEQTPHIITFFFKPLHPAKNFTADKFNNKAATHGALTYSLVKQHLANSYLVSGICVTYAGFSRYSDTNGQILFPRQSLRPRIRIFVTQSIKPIFYPTAQIPTSTVHHWELIKGVPASYHIVELTENEKGEKFWQTTEQTVPKNRRIPLDALVIFADPKNVLVPVGLSLAVENTAHFLLPNIYVSPKISPTLSALRFLKVRRYFSPVSLVYKYVTKGYIEKLAPN